MSTAFLATVGIAAGVIKLIGLIPYVKDIFRKKTKPERATWWIWTILNAVALGALIDAGGKWQLIMIVCQTLITGLIAILSVRFGYGTFRRKDMISIICAVIGVVLWQVTDQPILALLVVIAVDALAALLTAVKTWEDPTTETLSAWIMSTLGDFFGVLAVGTLNTTQLSYPVYILVADAAVMSIIFYRRKHFARAV